MGTERALAVAVENEAKKTYTYSGLKFKKKVHFMKCFFLEKAATIMFASKIF